MISDQYKDILPQYPGIFRSIKLIEKDEVLQKRNREELERLDQVINAARKDIKRISGQDVEGASADYR